MYNQQAEKKYAELKRFVASCNKLHLVDRASKRNRIPFNRGIILGYYVFLRQLNAEIDRLDALDDSVFKLQTSPTEPMHAPQPDRFVQLCNFIQNYDFTATYAEDYNGGNFTKQRIREGFDLAYEELKDDFRRTIDRIIRENTLPLDISYLLED